ncbi:MAG TPA: folylpolyglutamate synthase/dihydrofolate synthase family protein [Thermoanaerobaculia bacterium]|jgi:dihydrofolate synthase/folylpolyglutamate synthase|nr:folylpolyglutamate synthase/dihydrofolate synthase family protein [Thermoanaerobaculia bacterium]
MNALTWLDALQGSGIRPGLGRVRTLLRALGNPQHAYPSIIVAGTNGKGSTSAMLASILKADGRRTAHYTSPHLVDLRERWTIGGEMIDPALLDECIVALQNLKSDVTPTYFEALTLIAFLAFARAKCDIAVLEVGMGGRLDATNVVKPLAALITPIGIDHTEFLGNTIRKIAAEKAGVLHRGAIALTSNDDPVVLDVIRKRAAKFGSRFIHVTEEYDTPLIGDFQRRNAGLAVRAARELGIHEHAIQRGVQNTRWRGRLEHLHVQGKDIWIDGGHNAHAVTATAPFFDANVPHPRLLVFGMMSDKDVDAVVARVFPLFDRVIATEPYPPRSVRAETFRGAIAIPNPDDAFRAALAAPEQSIVITGSLYLAGAAIAFFDKIPRL